MISKQQQSGTSSWCYLDSHADTSMRSEFLLIESMGEEFDSSSQRKEGEPIKSSGCKFNNLDKLSYFISAKLIGAGTECH